MPETEKYSELLQQVRLYTDGGCSPNPGPGGYGTILVYGQYRKELSGGYQLTTNNRMEITAVIMGLKALKKKCVVQVYTDSKYVKNTMSLGWAARWRDNGWCRDKKRTKKAINPDLWQEMLDLCEKHEVEFIWVKGHAGHRENERCDEIAGFAMKKSDLPPDAGYQESLENDLEENKLLFE
ncbi:MAG: ribonuclease HI [Phycisphaerae bacterium]|nr:ribonuclease HI [Phycisphaerae bacterium]